MITILTAPPFATIQDLGRTGFRELGVPVSGIADRQSGIALNTLLGNDPNAAMIEWAVAGGVIRFDDSVTVAIGGAESACSMNGRTIEPWSAIHALAGEELHVERIIAGRFLLIAVRGGIDVPLVLGSRSTLVSAAIGGMEGRRLRTDDRLPTGSFAVSAIDNVIANPARSMDGKSIPVRRGPQANLFDGNAWETFLDTAFAVSRASDRTGYRLQGAMMNHRGSASFPSEPTCVGAIQVPDGGEPVVIMHDGPTVGGYPKIAVIRSSFLSRFAQLAPGDRVRFVLEL